MKKIIPVLLIFMACRKGGTGSTPVETPNPIVTFQSSAAYSANGNGTLLTATAINISVKVYKDGQVDSIVLVDEISPHNISPLLIPVSKDYTILDDTPPYPSGRTYHLETHVHGGVKIISSSFTAI